jgi:hypothetical protein
MALKSWTPCLCSPLLIFGMALEAGSVSYHCQRPIVWLSVLKRHPLDQLPGQRTWRDHHLVGDKSHGENGQERSESVSLLSALSPS